MALDLYSTGLLVLVPLATLVVGQRVFLRPFCGARQEKVTTLQDIDADAFRKTFLRVYLVVMGSEWLQGPYMYSLLRDEKALDERTVAILYVTTYVSAAASAFFTGYLADKVGRRAACLAYCAIHSLASVSVSFDAVEILIAGRVLGGICLNLLWTVFESWMVSEYNARALEQSSFPLSAMFGIMTKYNCMTAIIAGVLSHCIVLVAGSKATPFTVGVAFDMCAALLMLWTWNENRGAIMNSCMESRDGDIQSSSPQTTAVLKDARIWVLSFASCCFEGTIFIFTFFWPGTLQRAHDKEYPGDGYATPYGVVFANLMAAMVLGALLFNLLTRSKNPAERDDAASSGVKSPTSLLGMALSVSAFSFLIAAASGSELQFFLSFLLLELCNGVYVPSMAYHRGTIVGDSGRALIYGLMNIPLFVFVIAAIYTTSNGATLAVVLGLGGVAVRPGFRPISARSSDNVEPKDKETLTSCDSE
ncbi:MFS general substrate transporter [Hypoxylon sp. FL1284]|nr:MFS general substrate transporter [Hypoxylon sp. FL1284]